VAQIGAAALAFAAVSSPTLAHHSFAPYDPTVQVSFRAVVTHFQWTNPHVYMELDQTDESGEVRHWLIECANPGILNRIGWTWNMIEVGDEVTVIVSPLRNGEPGALLKGVRLPDGSEFSNGGPAGRATIAFAE
jgi:hypothetical protein